MQSNTSSTTHCDNAKICHNILAMCNTVHECTEHTVEYSKRYVTALQSLERTAFYYQPTHANKPAPKRIHASISAFACGREGCQVNPVAPFTGRDAGPSPIPYLLVISRECPRPGGNEQEGDSLPGNQRMVCAGVIPTHSLPIEPARKAKPIRRVDLLTSRFLPLDPRFQVDCAYHKKQLRMKTEN